MSSSLKVMVLVLGLVVAGGAAFLVLTAEDGGEDADLVSPVAATADGSERVDLPDAPALPESERAASERLDVDRSELTGPGTTAAGLAAADADDAVPQVTLTGRVIDLDGRPVPDATVTFLAGGDRQLRMRFRRFNPQDTEEIELPEATTDAAGRFEITGEVAERLGEDAERFFRLDAMVAVTHDAFATLVEPQPDLIPGTLDVGDLVVEPGAWLLGRVVDAGGRPLEGIDVRARNHVERQPGTMGFLSFFGGAITEFLTSAQTGSDGRFVIKGLQAGEASVTARAEGMKLASAGPIEVQPSGRGDVGDLVMEEGQTIAGTVTDEDGVPVEGALIRVSSMARIMINRMEDMPRRDVGHEMSLRAETDASGYFELSGLTGGTYTVHASAQGFARTSEEDVPVGTYDVTLRLQALGGLFVRVVDRDTGAGVDGAELDAEERVDSGRGGFRMRRMGGETRPVLTGADALAAAGLPDEDPVGAYLIQDASPEGMEVTVRAEGFAETTAEADGVWSNEVGELTVEMLPETIVAGYVRDEQGDPIEHARVRLSEPEDDGDGWAVDGHGNVEVTREVRRSFGGRRNRGGPGEGHVARTDSNGFFEVRGVPAGEWELVARAESFVRSEPLSLSLGEGETRDDVELELALGGTIAGVVTEADGEPVAGMDVTIASTDVAPEPEIEGLPPGLRMIGGLGGGEGTHRATTDSDGRYEQGSLPAGRYRVKLAPASMTSFGGGRGGFMSFVMEGEDDGSDEGALFVDVVAGATATADFVRPRRGEIKGRVMAAGEPAADVTVSLREAGSFMPFGGREATTDRLGNYLFEDVEAGEYEVSALPAGAGLEERADVDVRMGESRIADLNFGGATLRGRVIDEDSGVGAAGVFLTVAEVQEDAGGGFAGGFGGGEVQFQIVTAVDDGGSSGGMEMTIGGGPVSRVKTDNQGWFELKYLQPGTYTIETNRGGYISTEAGPFDVGENELVDGIEIEVVRGAVVEGVVVSGKTGDVLPQVPVRLTGGGVQEMTSTDRNGAFTFEGLAAGEYEVNVMGSGFFAEPIAQEAVSLDTGEQRRVSLITDDD